MPNLATAGIRLSGGYVIAWIDADSLAKSDRNASLGARYFGRRGIRARHPEAGREMTERLPALVILDADGRRIATEISGNLEDRDRYQH
jgi:hypothetical protein